MSGLQGVEGISSGRNDNVVGPASKECKGRIGGVSRVGRVRVVWYAQNLYEAAGRRPRSLHSRRDNLTNLELMSPASWPWQGSDDR